MKCMFVCFVCYVKSSVSRKKLVLVVFSGMSMVCFIVVFLVVSFGWLKSVCVS